MFLEKDKVTNDNINVGSVVIINNKEMNGILGVVLVKNDNL